MELRIGHDVELRVFRPVPLFFVIRHLFVRLRGKRSQHNSTSSKQQRSQFLP